MVAREGEERLAGDWGLERKECDIRWLLGGFSCVTLGGDLLGRFLGDGVALGFVDLVERWLGGAGGVEVVVSHGGG